MICKYCYNEIDSDRGMLKPDKYGFFFVCEVQFRPNVAIGHAPMDNLDYIEYVAKQKNLI